MQYKVSVVISSCTKLQKEVSQYFHALTALQSQVLASYLKPGAPAAKTFHQARVTLFQVMQKLRLFVPTPPERLLNKLEHMYEIIFSLNQLKFRLNDAATFEICAKEFKEILFTLTQLMKKAELFCQAKCSSLTQELTQFATARIAFAEVYQGTLQVVTYEPIVFLFFLQDLQALHEEIESFATDFAEFTA